MFIQIVTGKTPDAAAFERALEAWQRDARPTAEGYLGGTMGTTSDDTFFISARFESPEAAEKNNDKPAQTAWAEAQSATMTDVEYHNCSTVLTMDGGGSDDAGFVQVMVGRIKDRAKFDTLNARIDEMERAFRAWRDDVLGEVMALHDDGLGFHDIIYFRSEAEARENEQRPPTPEVQAFMEEMGAAADIVAYLDLSHPIFS